MAPARSLLTQYSVRRTLIKFEFNRTEVPKQLKGKFENLQARGNIRRGAYSPGKHAGFNQPAGRATA
jgi:hypothetical protein